MFGDIEGDKSYLQPSFSWEGKGAEVFFDSQKKRRDGTCAQCLSPLRDTSKEYGCMERGGKNPVHVEGQKKGVLKWPRPFLSLWFYLQTSLKSDM